MPSDWKPNAPALKKHFDQAPKPTPKRIASVIELKRLEKERRPPALQLNPPMPGPTARAAAAQASREREGRMAEIKNQLSANRGQAQKQFQRYR